MPCNSSPASLGVRVAPQAKRSPRRIFWTHRFALSLAKCSNSRQQLGQSTMPKHSGDSLVRLALRGRPSHAARPSFDMCRNSGGAFTARTLPGFHPTRATNPACAIRLPSVLLLLANLHARGSEQCSDPVPSRKPSHRSARVLDRALRSFGELKEGLGLVRTGRRSTRRSAQVPKSTRFPEAIAMPASTPNGQGLGTKCTPCKPRLSAMPLARSPERRTGMPES